VNRFIATSLTFLAMISLISAFSPPSKGASAGMLVVLNKSDDTASLIDRATGREVAVIPTGAAPHEVAVSPDGKLAVVANYGDRDAPGSTLTVIDLAAARAAKTIPLRRDDETFHRPHGLAFLPGTDRIVVTAEGEQALLVVGVAKGVVDTVLRTDQAISHMVAVTPNGERGFVANIGSGTVTVFDLRRGKKIADIETGEGAEGVAVSPDGAEVWVTNRAADTLTIVDPGSLELLATLDSPSFPIRIAFTPDGRHALVSCARSGDVAVFDTEARSLVRRVAMQVKAGEKKDERLFGDRFGDSPVPIGILVPPDGRHAYVANTNADMVTVIDLSNWEITGRLTAGAEPDGMAYSPLGPPRPDAGASHRPPGQ
jgi:YVTN family beta-propeller protein